MKKYNVKLVIFLLIFIPGNFFFTSKVFATSVDFDLSTIPKDVLFDISNMKPGDWAIRDLIVQNKGVYDFNYTLKVINVGGSRVLYDELLLQVTKESALYFNGYLKEFRKFSPRFLAKGTEETIQFRIEMPYELGNEFQGLTSSFEIELHAERIHGGSGGNPPDGNPNPNDPPDGNPNPNDPPDGNPNPNDPPDEGTNPPDGNPNPDDLPNKGTNPPDDNPSPDDPSHGNTPPPDYKEPPDDSPKTSAPGPTSNKQPPSKNVAIPSNPNIPAQRTNLLLPNTASNTFNLFFTGLLMITTGFILLFAYRRRKKQITNQERD